MFPFVIYLGVDSCLRRHLIHRPLVFCRHDLDKLAALLGPVVQNLAGAQAACPLVVVFDEFFEQCVVCLTKVQRVSLLSGSSDLDKPTIAVLQRLANWPSTSYTYATPPLMPAAKLRPVLPSTTAVPPVMYSQP